MWLTIYLCLLLSLYLIFKTRASLDRVLEIGKKKISKWNDDGPKMFLLIKMPYLLVHKYLQSIFILHTTLFFTHSSVHWLTAISAVCHRKRTLIHIWLKIICHQMIWLSSFLNSIYLAGWLDILLFILGCCFCFELYI